MVSGYTFGILDLHRVVTGYPFGIFKLFLDLRRLVTPLVS
jgi:hypothetical protein